MKFFSIVFLFMINCKHLLIVRIKYVIEKSLKMECFFMDWFKFRIKLSEIQIDKILKY